MIPPMGDWLFDFCDVPFCGNQVVEKGHKLETAPNGEIVGFKSSRLLSNPLLHLSFDQLIFDP